MIRIPARLRLAATLIRHPVHGREIARLRQGNAALRKAIGTSLQKTAEWAGIAAQNAVKAGQAQAEVARLRAGEADAPADAGRTPTPAEWIRAWNDADAKTRRETAEAILRDTANAERCFADNHRGRIAQLHERADHAERMVKKVFDRARLVFPEDTALRYFHAPTDLDRMAEVVERAIGLIVNPAYVETFPQADGPKAEEIRRANAEEARVLDMLAARTRRGAVPVEAARAVFGPGAEEEHVFDEWVNLAAAAFQEMPDQDPPLLDDMLAHVLAAVAPAIMEHGRRTARTLEGAAQ